MVEGHAPVESSWTLVVREDGVLIAAAECACGNGWCGWTASTYLGPDTLTFNPPPADHPSVLCPSIDRVSRYRCVLPTGHAGTHTHDHIGGWM